MYIVMTKAVVDIAQKEQIVEWFLLLKKKKLVKE